MEGCRLIAASLLLGPGNRQDRRMIAKRKRRVHSDNMVVVLTCNDREALSTLLECNKTLVGPYSRSESAANEKAIQGHKVEERTLVQF